MAGKKTKATFGDFLAGLREDAGLSQVDFADKMGMSKQNLCDIERGRRYTTPKTAASLAKKLGVPSSKLVKLSLQDLINRDGLKFKVDVKAG